MMSYKLFCVIKKEQLSNIVNNLHDIIHIPKNSWMIGNH